MINTDIYLLLILILSSCFFIYLVSFKFRKQKLQPKILNDFNDTFIVQLRQNSINRNSVKFFRYLHVQNRIKCFKNTRFFTIKNISFIKNLFKNRIVFFVLSGNKRYGFFKINYKNDQPFIKMKAFEGERITKYDTKIVLINKHKNNNKSVCCVLNSKNFIFSLKPNSNLIKLISSASFVFKNLADKEI